VIINVLIIFVAFFISFANEIRKPQAADFEALRQQQRASVTSYL
jgi:hypothetical protein